MWFYLPPEAVLCRPCLRSVEKLIKLKADVHIKRRDQNESEASWTGLLWSLNRKAVSIIQ